MKTGSSPKVQLPFSISAHFIPSGWMGDGEFGDKYLSIVNSPGEVNHELVVVTRIEYLPGPKRWAGIYWQHPENNWGDMPGKNMKGAQQISFFAKGENGGEVVEFKIGGITGKYSDTIEKSTGKIVLTSEWKIYTIDIASENLESVIGGFAWVAESRSNRSPIITYLSKLVAK